MLTAEGMGMTLRLNQPHLQLGALDVEKEEFERPGAHLVLQEHALQLGEVAQSAEKADCPQTNVQALPSILTHQPCQNRQ